MVRGLGSPAASRACPGDRQHLEEGRKMLAALSRQYAPLLVELNEMMFSELERWRSEDTQPLWSITHALLERHGKQLRPLLSLMMTDHLGGDPRTVIPAAGSVEFYHIASLVLDDVQDHSDI